ncbi:DMT family transporter [Acidihalobacter prosperus]|uniref:Membrane protein n=1 Tax=Acidihalobacter prosperus TaxID=160660 RepID=A0A1A6C4U4_9GAMM|nr:DMT family transporter [Acidihalobacter prosperus]OBS09582.1 membrane protein [Acidihalobacter prosperus]
MTYLKLFAMALFWGGTFVSGRLLSGHVDPAAAAFIRFTFASICLLFLAQLIEGGLPRLGGRQVLAVLLLGATGVFAYNLFFFKALETLAAGRAAATIAMNPALIALLSWLLLRESLSGVRLFGIATSLCGALIVISHGEPARLLDGGLPSGTLDILVCLVSWVAYSLIGRQVMRGLTPLASVTYSSMAGALMLLWPALHGGVASAVWAYTAMDWGNLAYLGIAGTALGFVWYYQGIKRIGATRASIFINIVPISAVTLGHLILGEVVDGSLVVGGLLVIGGVYLTNVGLANPFRRRTLA